MSDEIHEGSCLCGKVRYRYTGRPLVFQYCHCERCRKFTGSVHGANVIVHPDNFEWIQGEESIGRFEVEDAKDFATQFCRNCGSSLPWKTQTERAVVIPAGTLDDDPNAEPIHNIYWDSRAVWHVHTSELPQYPELPIKKK